MIWDDRLLLNYYQVFSWWNVKVVIDYMYFNTKSESTEYLIEETIIDTSR